MEAQFITGIILVIFGVLLIVMGVMIPDFMYLLLPVALVFICGGVALKIISIKNLG